MATYRVPACDELSYPKEKKRKWGGSGDNGDSRKRARSGTSHTKVGLFNNKIFGKKQKMSQGSARLVSVIQSVRMGKGGGMPGLICRRN